MSPDDPPPTPDAHPAPPPGAAGPAGTPGDGDDAGPGPDGDGTHAGGPEPTETEGDGETASQNDGETEGDPASQDASEAASEAAGEGEGAAGSDVGEEPAHALGRRGRWRARQRRRWATWAPRSRVAAFAVAGAVITLSLAGRVPARVGPFETTVAARPSLAGETVVRLAPLGTIQLDTHDWPLRLDLRVDELGLDEAERIAEDPELVDTLGDDLADEVRDALVRLALRCALLALGGGLLGALAARVSWRSAVTGVTAGAVLVGTVGAGTAATFDAEAVAEPRYTGLLTVAPTAVGDVEAIVERFGEYRAQLSDLVGNIVTLYLAAEGLPTFQPTDNMIRVLHVSDIHLNPSAYDVMDQVAEQFGVDAIVDTGDLTDWGTGTEELIVEEIGRLDVPYVYVRGNHDSLAIQRAVAAQPNAVVLDGQAVEVAGLTMWGIGDPRYTPNKEENADTASERRRIERFAPDAARNLAASEPPAVDVALVHDPRVGPALAGEVPLVLAGHTHEASEERLRPPAPEAGEDGEDGTTTGTDGGDGAPATAEDGTGRSDETLMLTQGSTGGAGLRGLQGEQPEPLVASVLYFDRETRTLVAYDQVTVDGIGGSGATIERTVVADELAGRAATTTSTATTVTTTSP